MEELVQGLTKSDDLDSENIESTADETAEKVSKIMETYLGEDPDTQEALEFLCLAEGGEVTHYEVRASIAKDVTNKKFGTTVRAILKEEQGHLQLCTAPQRRNALSRHNLSFLCFLYEQVFSHKEYDVSDERYIEKQGMLMKRSNYVLFLFQVMINV